VHLHAAAHPGTNAVSKTVGFRSSVLLVLSPHDSNVNFIKMKLASAPARYFSRWSTLAASFVISVLCGLGYAFGLYSDTLQTKLGYSQRTLDLVASFGKLVKRNLSAFFASLHSKLPSISRN
jgi:Na+/H+ antiporter NhaA